jgi:iron complex outermembrane recepter protein
MNLKLWVCMSFVVSLWIPLSVSAETRELQTNDRQLNPLEPAYTTVQEWLEAQTEEAAFDTIAITNVRLKSTEAGVDVILDSAASLPSPRISTVSNALIIEIPNAVLTYGEFEQTEPAPGIARISVTRLPGNRVRIAIAGTDAPPTATVQSQSQTLTVSVTPAASAASAADDALRVVVTANETPEDPVDVPLSSTVLTQDDIDDAQINTVREVAANTPNFFTSGGDRTINFYSLRGIGNSNFQVRDSVGFYVDDVPIELFYEFFPNDLFDIGRVEVLRGPQNTYYGRSSSAGVVNVTSRPPSENLETTIGAEYGAYNQRRLQVSLSDTLIPDRLGFRLSGVYSARDGFTENTLLGKAANDQSDVAGRLNLVWTPSENWSVSLNALGAFSQDGGIAYATLGQDNPFEIAENQIAALDLSVSAQSLKVAYDGADVRFTSVTAHNFSNVSYGADGDFSADDLYRADVGLRSNIWSQEFRLQSPADAGRFAWLVGAYAQTRQFDVDSQKFEYTQAGSARFNLPNLRSAEGFAFYDQTTLAAFGQVDFTPVDPLTLTLGLRYEHTRDELDRRDRLETFDGVATTLGNVSDTIDGDVLLPRIALTYRLSPNAAVYGSVSRGYRPVTLNLNVGDPNLNDIPQESSWNYEVGFKSSWLDDRLNVRLAAFINEIDDYQVLLPNPTGYFTEITTAQVRVTGFEAEVRAIPLEGLELTAGFGYANAEYLDYKNPLTNASYSGNALTFAPEYTLNLAAQYRSPGGFFSRLELQGFGTTFFNADNTLKQDPFVLCNARIGYEFDHSGVYVFANNLFDQEYVAAAYNLTILGRQIANFGDRRTFGVQFQTRF